MNKLHEFVSMRQAKGIKFLSIYRLMHIQVCEFKMAIDIGLESNHKDSNVVQLRMKIWVRDGRGQTIFYCDTLAG